MSRTATPVIALGSCLSYESALDKYTSAAVKFAVSSDHEYSFIFQV